MNKEEQANFDQSVSAVETDMETLSKL